MSRIFNWFMECVFCEQGPTIHGGWKLTDGSFGCNKCIIQCEQSSCDNLAFQRHRGVSNCKQCWEKSLKEKEERARRSYEESLARWNDGDVWFRSLMNKPKFSSIGGYFCPDCKNLLDSGKCGNTKNCNIGSQKLLIKKKQTHQDDEIELEDSGDDYFSSFIKSLDGYFEWPSTETKPKWFGSTILDTNGWPEESPLKLLGYNVNQKDNLSVDQRWNLLKFIFTSPRLPWVKDQQYMLEWGAAESAARLKRIANHLATMGRKMRRKEYEIALSRYDADLNLLKTEYYDPMFKFVWPSTDDY